MKEKKIIYIAIALVAFYYLYSQYSASQNNGSGQMTQSSPSYQAMT